MNLDVWDVVLMAAAAYLAVTNLVRLMTWRRDGILEDLSRQAARHRKRQQRAEKRERRRQLRQPAEAPPRKAA